MNWHNHRGKKERNKQQRQQQRRSKYKEKKIRPVLNSAEIGAKDFDADRSAKQVNTEHVKNRKTYIIGKYNAVWILNVYLCTWLNIISNMTSNWWKCRWSNSVECQIALILHCHCQSASLFFLLLWRIFARKLGFSHFFSFSSSLHLFTGRNFLYWLIFHRVPVSFIRFLFGINCFSFVLVFLQYLRHT